MPLFQIITFCFLAGICCLQFFSELPSLLFVSAYLSTGAISTFILIFILRRLGEVKKFQKIRKNEANQKIENIIKSEKRRKKFLLKVDQISKISYCAAIPFMLGFLWMWLHCNLHLSKNLPETMEGKSIVVVGIIDSIPEKVGEDAIRFEFKIKKTIPEADWPNPGRILLYLSNHSFPANINASKKSDPFSVRKEIKVGDEWQFKVKLKRPFNYANPGSFDKEKHFFQNRWHAQGTIIEDIIQSDFKNVEKHLNTENNAKDIDIPQKLPVYSKKISSYGYSKPIDRLRTYFLRKMREHLDKTHFGEVMIALVVGFRDGISQAEWQVFRDTGTAHLMAISGLHVGLMAGFSYFCFGFVWRHLKLIKYIKFLKFIGKFKGLSLLSTLLSKGYYKINTLPTPWISAWGAMFGATVYSLLAGFSVPTQRSLVMVVLFMLQILFRKKGSGWQNYSLALLMVLLIDPFSTLSSGFWLSFGAVGIILFGMQNRLETTQSSWWKWGRTQWVVFLGLAPFSFIFFQKLSIVSPLINSIAIPWVSFAVVPLALMGTLLLTFPFTETLAHFFLLLAEKTFACIWPLLEISARLPKATWAPEYFSNLTLVLFAFGIFILLLPRGIPARYLGLICCLPFLINKTPPLTNGSLRFTLLDVGQGLASVIETSNHTLVFDTGPNLSIRGRGIDTGEQVLLPFLTRNGIKSIDAVVISHGDNDHIGGLSSLLKNIPVSSIITSETDTVRKDSIVDLTNSLTIQPCYVGQHWDWDGVHFEMLHPESFATKKRNDHSCVLRVSTNDKSLILTGDIETKSELKIIERSTTSSNLSMASTILIVPHHGSGSSSSLEFIQAVNPQYALIPVGYRNAYKHPKPEVVERYRTLGIKVLDTVHEGAITFLLDDNTLDNNSLVPECYRKQNKQLWHAK